MFLRDITTGHSYNERTLVESLNIKTKIVDGSGSSLLFLVTSLHGIHKCAYVVLCLAVLRYTNVRAHVFELQTRDQQLTGGEELESVIVEISC